MPSIKWVHNRQRLLLPVTVLTAANSEHASISLRVTALLDTGATGTGIRADLVEALGLMPKGQRRIATANGLIWASEVLFRIGFVVGDYEAPGFDPEIQQPYVLDRHVTGFELHRGFDYAMLVGMDVLGQCDLHILRNGRAELLIL